MAMAILMLRVWRADHFVYRRTATMRKVYVYALHRTFHFGRINGRWDCGMDLRP